MEPVEECLRDVQVQQALEKGDYTAAMQHVEELKQKAMDESVEAVGLLCRMQLRTAELQIAHATGDVRRMRAVLAEIPLSAFVPGKIKFVDDQTSAAGIVQEFHGRMKLMDRKVAGALSVFTSADKTYARCGSKRLAACKHLVLFCRLVQRAAGGYDFLSNESADKALLELLVPLAAAIGKADLGAMRSIVDGHSLAELVNDGLLDVVSQWLKALEDTNRFLTAEGQELVGGSDWSGFWTAWSFQ